MESSLNFPFNKVLTNSSQTISPYCSGFINGLKNTLSLFEYNLHLLQNIKVFVTLNILKCVNVKLRVLTVGVLFFAGHTVMAQKAKRDTAGKVKDIQEVILVGGIKLDPAQKVGAYNVVSKANFESTPFSSVDDILNGRVAGLNFSSASG